MQRVHGVRKCASLHAQKVKARHTSALVTAGARHVIEPGKQGLRRRHELGAGVGKAR